MTSPNFEYAVAETLKHEGGYVDHPNDPGGATNYGISLRFLKGVRPEATADDIKNLSVAEAKGVYFAHFWLPWYDDLPREMAYQVFDMAVNAGTKTALRLLQRALRSCGFPLVDDGVMGPKTRNAIDELLEDGIVPCTSYRSERAGYYRILAAKKPSMRVFLNGWLRRAYGV